MHACCALKHQHFALALQACCPRSGQQCFMALVSRRLDDIHYATDTEGDGCASASEEAVPNPERRRGLSVKSLAQRRCRCSAKACFTPFNSAAGIATVLAARADYAALEKDMQDVYISLNCLRRDPLCAVTDLPQCLQATPALMSCWPLTRKGGSAVRLRV